MVAAMATLKTKRLSLVSGGGVVAAGDGADDMWTVPLYQILYIN